MNLHNKHEYHKNSVISGKGFIHTYENPQEDIKNKLYEDRFKAINENRSRLTSIIETIIFLGRQNIPLRGHRDDGDLSTELQSCSISPVSENGGNFRELLLYRVKSGDIQLEQFLNNSSSRATYISKTIQNELIQICGSEILDTILCNLNKAKYYSIMFDETTDISHISQMALIVRYLHNNTVREDFIGFIDCHQAKYSEKDLNSELDEPKLTGKIIGEIVLQHMKKLSINLNDCVGIATDGCSTMASEQKGAVAHLKTTLKHAVRTPCYSHALNLTLSKSNSVQSIRNSVGVIKETIAFFNASAKRNHILKLYLKTNLIGLCETRWVERHLSIIQFKSYLMDILKALNSVSHWREVNTSSKARVLISALCNAEFIISVFCLSYLFSLTLPLSNKLQKVDLDKALVENNIKITIDTINDKRQSAEETFASICLEATLLMESLDIDFKVPRVIGNQKNRPNPNVSTTEEYYRITIFIPLLDAILEDINDRFNSDTLNIYNLGNLLPSNILKLNKIELNKYVVDLSNNFGSLLDIDKNNLLTLLSGEMDIWRKYWSAIPAHPQTAIEVVSMCDIDIYPTIINLLKILSTYPISVASAERSFSSLRRLKTWLRSNLTEECLIGLALLHIHRDIPISVTNILDKFAKNKKRRLEFVI